MNVHIGLQTSEKTRLRERRELIAYFALTFAITWGLGILAIFFRRQFEAIVGPIGTLNLSWPYFVAVYSPTISAVVISAAFAGFDGLKELALGLVRPFQPRWLAVSTLVFPAGLLMWGLAQKFLPTNSPSASVDVHAILVSAPIKLFTTVALFTDPGAFGEEIGWRGFALPRLLARFDSMKAAIILGAVWGLWHLPAFFVSGLSQSTFNFAWFMLGIVSESVFMTWVYVHAGGNFLVAGILPHAVLNLMFDVRAFGSIKVEAIVLASVAAALTAVYGLRLKKLSDDRNERAVNVEA